MLMIDNFLVVGGFVLNVSTRTILNDMWLSNSTTYMYFIGICVTQVK